MSAARLGHPQWKKKHPGATPAWLGRAPGRHGCASAKEVTTLTSHVGHEAIQLEGCDTTLEPRSSMCVLSRVVWKYGGACRMWGALW